ncbi:hypothetical protein KVT40_008783 [Elsinoe batatas]|uniref:Uncharacterized protein n=1 Tax=Elsinoe batatas TaxID=2601811 RepID=A0A8K0PCR1_9PEZI|nr:hypothetical protein KVT40_008783 [Elsinoe batatas]
MTDQASLPSGRAAVQSDEYPTSLGHDTSYPEHLAPPSQTGHSDDHSTNVPEDVQLNAEIDGLHPSTSLGFTNFLFAQRADGRLQGYNITWEAEFTRLDYAEGSPTYRSLTVGVDPGGDAVLNGTHFSVTTLQSRSGGNDIVVFAQVVGNDIVSFRRDAVGGSWSRATLDIPKK